jgi:hypothetical protein
MERDAVYRSFIERSSRLTLTGADLIAYRGRVHYQGRFDPLLYKPGRPTPKDAYDATYNVEKSAEDSRRIKQEMVDANLVSDDEAEAEDGLHEDAPVLTDEFLRGMGRPKTSNFLWHAEQTPWTEEDYQHREYLAGHGGWRRLFKTGGDVCMIGVHISRKDAAVAVAKHEVEKRKRECEAETREPGP